MVKDIIIGIIRQMIAVALGAWIAELAKSGVATEGQVIMVIGVAVTFVINLAWSVTERLLKHWNLTAALELGAGSTGADLRAVTSQVPMTTKLSQAATLNTADLHEKLRETVERTEFPAEEPPVPHVPTSPPS